MGFRLFVEVVAERRRVVQQRLHVRVLGVQHPQRVGVHPAFAVFIQFIGKLLQVSDQRVAVVGTRFQRTDGVQLKADVIGDAQLTPPARGQHNQLGIDVRALQAKHFGADLVELAVATFLRALVTEHWPDVPQTLFLIVQQTMFDAGTYAARRPFRTQRQAVAVAVLKGVHLFFNHVGHFADRAFE